jgi:hypothetical protein
MKSDSRTADKGLNVCLKMRKTAARIISLHLERRGKDGFVSATLGCKIEVGIHQCSKRVISEFCATHKIESRLHSV